MTTPAAAADDHVFAVRVYYEDTDAAGIVYYASYLKFAERARTEMMRAWGFDTPSLLAREGVMFAVRRGVVDYRAPARLDDHLAISSRVTSLRGASFEVQQIARRDGVDLCRMTFTLACVTAEARPSRLPETIASAIAENSQFVKR
jgi:acyl-CoA thioester hydrolase